MRANTAVTNPKKFCFEDCDKVIFPDFVQDGCGSDDHRAGALACQKATDFAKKCALGHEANYSLLVARNNFTNTLIDHIKVVCSGVFRKDVLVDHADLVL